MEFHPAALASLPDCEAFPAPMLARSVEGWLRVVQVLQAMQADPGLEHFADEYGKLLRTVKQLHGKHPVPDLMVDFRLLFDLVRAFCPETADRAIQGGLSAPQSVWDVSEFAVLVERTAISAAFSCCALQKILNWIRATTCRSVPPALFAAGSPSYRPECYFGHRQTSTLDNSSCCLMQHGFGHCLCNEIFVSTLRIARQQSCTVSVQTMSAT